MTCKNKEPVSSEIEEIASEPRMEEIASEPRMEGSPVLATGVTTPSLLARNATLSFGAKKPTVHPWTIVEQGACTFIS